MGGEIAVGARDPHGTRMTVRLPLATTAAAPPVPRTSAEDRIPARSRS
jgi:hypothetical protein